MRKTAPACIVVALLAAAMTCAAAEEGRLYVIAATGVSGDRAHYDKFWALLTGLRKAVVERLGARDDDVFLLFEEKSPKDRTIDGPSTRKSLEEVFKKVGEKVGGNDTVLIFLAGHADRVMGQVKWHLPGPDASPEDMARMLKVFEKGRVIIVVGTPLSGYFMKSACAEGRIVMSATLPTSEINETYFPYAFVETILDAKTDADKDGRLSVAELFEATKERVKQFFKEKDLLQTEHAMLDDNGDGLGTRELADDSPDGKIAKKTYLKLRTEL